MPRVSEPRVAAAPVSAEQRRRQQRILRAATRLGSDCDFEHVQMNDVAKEAGVALGTLYRYFPSKAHLFASILRLQVEKLVDTSARPPGVAPADAVAGLFVAIGHDLEHRRRLSLSIIQANNQVQTLDPSLAADIDAMFERLVCEYAGIGTPTAEQRRRIRLLVHCWFGALMSMLNGRAGIEDGDADIRLACDLLLAPI